METSAPSAPEREIGRRRRHREARAAGGAAKVCGVIGAGRNGTLTFAARAAPPAPRVAGGQPRASPTARHANGNSSVASASFSASPARKG